MDLIYADETRKDIGVLNSYDLDMAYGKDENDFQCSVDRSDHCCQEGYFIYAEDTEYGGVVDRIKVDTESDVVTYFGRTWHGILESQAICPDPGEDYLIVSGEANAVLQEIFEHIGLSELFEASDEDSGAVISNYQFDRYIYGYSGIKKMLKENELKLNLIWKNSMVRASAEPIYDYSQDEEFDTSQIDFTIEKNFRPINHVICLGQGDLRERAVIHIFADEAGGIQDYLTDPESEPVEDADYILDKSAQIMFGHDEVTEIYDVPNAEITTNYVQLTARPDDWEERCTDYFQYEADEEEEAGVEVDAGGQYKEVEKEKIGYLLQSAQPADWAENYDDYYTYDSSQDKYDKVVGAALYQLLASKPGNWAAGYSKYYKKTGSTYSEVTGVTTTKYSRQKKQPADWKKNFGKYYYFYSDGVSTEYRAVSGVTYYTYKRQTRKPTDWATSYGSYYRRATAKELKEKKSQKWYAVEKTKKNKVPAWKAKRYYTRISKTKAPVWKSAARYTRTDKTTAPAWAANTYYQRKGTTAPSWATGTYYTKTDLQIAPEWVSGKFFRRAFDRYAVMVAGAIEKLQGYSMSDKLGIDLSETDQTYDVGDIVGTREDVTGMEATQEVTKKIITIKNDDVVIRYEVD